MNSQYPSKAAIAVLIALAMGQTRPVPAQQQTSGAPAAGAAQTGRGPRSSAAPVAYDDYTASSNFGTARRLRTGMAKQTSGLWTVALVFA
jgi:hypothetical protein